MFQCELRAFVMAGLTSLFSTKMIFHMYFFSCSSVTLTTAPVGAMLLLPLLALLVGSSFHVLENLTLQHRYRAQCLQVWCHLSPLQSELYLLH